jgi:hypothetical protein
MLLLLPNVLIMSYFQFIYYNVLKSEDNWTYIYIPLATCLLLDLLPCLCLLEFLCFDTLLGYSYILITKLAWGRVKGKFVLLSEADLALWSFKIWLYNNENKQGAKITSYLGGDNLVYSGIYYSTYSTHTHIPYLLQRHLLCDRVYQFALVLLQ